MGFRKDFTVNITRLTTAVAQRGFGLILLLSNEVDSPYTLYSNFVNGSAASNVIQLNEIWTEGELA